MKTEFSRQRGYILAATIWVLAFLALGVGAMAEWYQQRLALAGESKAYTEQLLNEFNTEATLLYYISTRQIGAGGLFLQESDTDTETTDMGMPVARDGIPDIGFDGSPVAGFGDSLFAVQDENGLLAVNAEITLGVENLLVSQGIERSEAQAMVASLADYQDQDDLVRLNGAEKREYERAGLPPPPNRRIRSSFELRAVLGWHDKEALWENLSFPSMVSTVRGGTPNMRTAPRDVLASLRGISVDTAEELVASRREDNYRLSGNAVRELDQLRRGTDALSVATRPSPYLRLRFWRPNARQIREVSVQFTPGFEAKSPWVYEYNLILPAPPGYPSEPATTEKLPVFLL